MADYKWDAVVLDLDGTIADTLRDLADACNSALIKNGYRPYNCDGYKSMVGNGAKRLVERATREENKELVEQVLSDFIFFYNRDCLRFTKAYKGMNKILSTLKKSGVKLLVVTNKPDTQAQVITAELYGKNLFSGVYGVREGRKTKPDPGLTLDALASVKATPGNSLFIGDSDVDMYTAKNAGMKCAGVTWGFRSKDELISARADYIFESPWDILQVELL